jgi:uncharacterized protein (DUF1697 family)
MPTYISLLRGINVGGNKIIPMKALKTLYETLGFANVRTLLTSGNVVFETPRDDAGAMKTEIEQGIAATFGCQSVIILRTPEDLRAVVAACPFSEVERAQGSKLLVMFLLAAPTQTGIERLMSEHVGSEMMHVISRELYIFFPDGMGQSKLGNPQLERRLGAIGTGRNWNTVLKLVALAQKS